MCPIIKTDEQWKIRIQWIGKGNPIILSYKEANILLDRLKKANKKPFRNLKFYPITIEDYSPDDKIRDQLKDLLKSIPKVQ